jgi:hypothetical protein
MSYSIQNTDGTTLLLLADGEIDQVTTSITLVGKNISGYGQYFNNNFVKLLANSANISAPTNPLQGQLWYDTQTSRMKVYDGVFKTISGATIADSKPTTLTSGDLWFDTTNSQLKVFANNQVYLIGPAVSKTIGSTGINVPATPIKNNEYNAQQVTLIQSYGKTVGALSNSDFTVEANDAQTYFGTSNPVKLVNGLTIVGDIRVTGQSFSRDLSMFVNIDTLTPSYPDVNPTDPQLTDVTEQNNAIISLMNFMFPVESSTVKDDVGHPLGTECRVLCQYTIAQGASLPNPAFLVRRYKIQSNLIHENRPEWMTYNVYTTSTVYGTTSTNVVQA